MADTDDPFAVPDGTVLRPRPGAGRRPAAPGAGTAFSPSSAAPTRSSGAAGAVVGGRAAPLTDFLGGSRNPILQSAAPLLSLASRFAVAVPQASVATLRQQAVQEIRAFEERLRAAGVAREDELVARYVLCTFVDGAVLNTPWGAQGDWAAQSLLVMFHKEVSGGEKFFEILDRISGDPNRYLDLLELLYVCLALGYEGKYRQDPNGPARLAELQHRLFRLIRERRQIRDEPLSAHWQGIEDRRNRVLRYVPWWLIAIAGGAVVTGVFIVLHSRLAREAEPIKAALAAPAAPLTYAPAPARNSRLKQLLATEEGAGRLTVEELADRSVVTLTAPNLFRSGSARVNPDLYPTLRSVALALNQVPGRVLIVGHTDDQPVKSLQYADNFDLSRARAQAVSQVLKLALQDFTRVSVQGVGSTQPRYTPVDTAQNRARNRRVEIMQVAEPSGSAR
ncbi:MAG TPA: type IVB secretion system protein IcmH/DotU [Steroidobacteraceae bacterium]|nr:type IVB secretion system protein IcmH/DotU [Steroidobacteraceae bacterium]